MDLKEWLRPDEQGAPALRIGRNCHNLIRTLAALRYDGKGSGDAAREPHELTHAPDALRYFAAGRPRQNEQAVAEEKEPFHFAGEKGPGHVI